MNDILIRSRVIYPNFETENMKKCLKNNNMNNVLLREQQVFNYKSINAVTDVAKAYAIYKSLDKSQFAGNEYFPLIEGDFKWDHNSIWKYNVT